MMKVHCSICGKEAELGRTSDWPHFPFCSQRCRIIDLGRWLDERYSVPSRLEESESEPLNEVP